MAAERLDMKDVLEVLRLRVGEGLSERRVSKALGVSRSTVHEYVRRFQEAGLVWPCANLDELALVARLFPARDACVTPVAPDFGAVAVELRRKGVTLRLLWEEYQSQHGARAHAYSWYCELYGRWRLRQRLSMRQEHKGGEKLFVDFSGDGLWLWDVQSGERTAVRVFVAAMGASSLVYAVPVQQTTSLSS